MDEPDQSPGIERVDQPLDIETQDWKSGAFIWTDADPHDDEHLALLNAHPRFHFELERLREDLDQLPSAPRTAIGGTVIRAARADPYDVPYPLAAFSRKWGLAPVDAAAMVAMQPENRVFARERSLIYVEEREYDYVLRIPRPITPARRETLKRFLALARQRRGPMEDALLGTRNRTSLSPALLDALPYFKRWNNGESIASIYDSIEGTAGRAPSEDQIRKRVARLRERLIELSPEDIRSPCP